MCASVTSTLADIETSPPASVTSTLADIETSPPAINDSDIDMTVHLTTPTEVPLATCESVNEIVRSVMGNMLSQVEQNLNLKYGGFNTGFDNIYIKLACHQLSALDIVIEDNKLHNSTCKESGYRVCDGNYVNKLCSDLQYSQKLKKILERGRKSYAEKELLVTNNTYLSHNQLCEKAHMLQEEKRRLRLQVMNTVFKNSRLCATLSMHQRLLVSISENNIPRLQQLVNVSLKNNHSISYIFQK